VYIVPVKMLHVIKFQCKVISTVTVTETVTTRILQEYVAQPSAETGPGARGCGVREAWPRKVKHVAPEGEALLHFEVENYIQILIWLLNCILLAFIAKFEFEAPVCG